MTILGIAASSHTDLIPLKTAYKKTRGIALGGREFREKCYFLLLLHEK